MAPGDTTVGRTPTAQPSRAISILALGSAEETPIPALRDGVSCEEQNAGIDSGQFCESPRIQDPLVDPEGAFAIAKGVGRNHATQKRPCVSGVIQTDKKLNHIS